MSLKHLFGTFSKVTEQSDGTVLVEGTASSESRDHDKEIIRAAAMTKALPGYMKFANVREMHQAVAAGKAIACSVDEAGITHLTAHVVDAGSVAKVKAGVLQGFSIGGNVLKRNDLDKSIIEELELTEISLVDRPSNPDATFQLCKFEKAAACNCAMKHDGECQPAKIAAKAPLSTELRKSLFSVGWLAEVLSTLDCLASDAKWEEMYEGGASDIPARLKAAVAVLAEILRDMAAEETAELTGDQIAAAAQPGSLKKTEKLAGLLKALSLAAKGSPSAREQADAMFAKAMALLKPPEVAPVVDEALTKRASDAETALAKAKTDASDALAKVATLTTEKAEALDAMTKVAETLKATAEDRDTLAKNLTAANAELARKGVLRLVPIEKGQEGVKPAAEPEATTQQASANPVDAMKKVHSGGGFDPFRLQQGASK